MNNIDTSNQPLQPNDLNTERSVIGTLILYDEKFDENSDVLDDALFYDNTNKIIFRCLKGVHDQGEMIDILSLRNYSDIHEESAHLTDIDFMNLRSLADGDSFTQNLNRLIKFAKMRKAWEIMLIGASSAINPANNIDEAINRTISDLNGIDGGSSASSLIDSHMALNRLTGLVSQNQAGMTSGIKTGFKFIDDYGGFSKGELEVIAATYSSGKSALAMCIAKNAAINGIGCAYYSMEMTSNELWARIISADSKISSLDILRKKLDADQLQRFDQAIQKNVGLPIIIDESNGMTFEKACRSIRQLAKEKKIEMAVIDYLQIFAQDNGKPDNDESLLASIARKCKNLAHDLNIVIVLLSQLSRNKMNPHPKSNELRGSGQIAESADNIFLIDRPEAHPDWDNYNSYRGDHANVSIKGTAEIITAKGRGIGSGRASIIGFNGQYTQFYDLNHIPLKSEENQPNQQQTNIPFDPFDSH
jgi:replicative DNA helicase